MGTKGGCIMKTTKETMCERSNDLAEFLEIYANYQIKDIQASVDFFQNESRQLRREDKLTLIRVLKSQLEYLKTTNEFWKIAKTKTVNDKNEIFCIARLRKSESEEYVLYLPPETKKDDRLVPEKEYVVGIRFS